MSGATVRVVAAGPLVAALEIRGRIRTPSGRVAIRLVLTLHDGSPALRVTLEVDNGATDHRLRIRFPSGARGGRAKAGTAFGMVERDPVGAHGASDSRESPVATAPAQRVVVCAAADRGLALLAPGFFEYEQTRGGDLLVTVLRAVGSLSRSDLSTRPGHAGWPTPTPDAQCRGSDRMQLAVLPAGMALAGAALAALWEDVFLPPRAVWLRQATPLTLPRGELVLEGDGVVFSALKPAVGGDGVVLRCYNARSTPTRARCRFPFALAAATRTRADECCLAPLTIDRDRRTLRFGLDGHEIVTLHVRIALPPAAGRRYFPRHG